jgi:hypothetical protein
MIWLLSYLAVGGVMLAASFMLERDYMVTTGEILFAFALGPIALAFGLLHAGVGYVVKSLRGAD